MFVISASITATCTYGPGGEICGARLAIADAKLTPWKNLMRPPLTFPAATAKIAPTRIGQHQEPISAGTAAASAHIETQREASPDSSATGLLEVEGLVTGSIKSSPPSPHSTHSSSAAGAAGYATSGSFTPPAVSTLAGFIRTISRPSRPCRRLFQVLVSMATNSKNERTRVDTKATRQKKTSEPNRLITVEVTVQKPRAAFHARYGKRNRKRNARYGKLNVNVNVTLA